MSVAVSVILINWNGKHYLEQFLPALMATDYPNFEVIILDNHSTDDSVAFIKAHYPTIKLIENHTNDGFAEGNNKAITHAKNSYIVLLNTDAEVEPGWLKPLVHTMNSDHNLAAVQPKIKSWHQKDHFEYAGAAGGYIDKYGYPFCRGRIFDTAEIDSGQYDQPANVFWATGCAMLLRKSIVEKAGLFDRSFFAHMEEIDFCWRVQNMGHKIAVNPKSVVYHIGGETLPKTSPRKTFYNYRNGLMMMMKNLHRSVLIRTIFMRLVLDGVSAYSYLKKKGGWGLFMAVVKAHFAFYYHIPHCLRERKTYPKRKLNEMQGYYPKSIVKAYFGWKKHKFSDLNIQAKELKKMQ